jgi:hypothetical protein
MGRKAGRRREWSKSFRREWSRRREPVTKLEGQPRDEAICAFASVAVGREPQEGWHPRVAPTGNADSPAIETLKRPIRSEVQTGDRLFFRPCRSAREESTRTRARRGGGESLEEETRASSPCPCRKARTSDEGPWEPQERSGDETSPIGFRVKQTVETVRNRQDGTCRRVGFLRDIRAPDSVERCRGRNPRRGALGKRSRVRWTGVTTSRRTGTRREESFIGSHQ